MYYYRENELYHHGIMGMHWGDRNGPPYPLNYNSHSSTEKRQNTKASLSAYTDSNGQQSLKRYKKTGKTAEITKNDDKDKKEKITRDILKRHGTTKVNSIASESKINKKSLKQQLNITDEQAAQIKKWAKIAGISLATTAGIVAAGYYISRTHKIHQMKQPQILQEGFNRWFKSTSLNIGDDLLKNHSNGDYIGAKAGLNGFGLIDAEHIKSSIKNRIINNDLDDDLYDIVENVRLNQVDAFGSRRLSCWSASQSYFMSALTGHEYVSMSFENVVNFNDFGKLYKKKPKIFNAAGKRTLDFVGKFGREEARATSETAETLIKNIFKNVNSKNNLAVDGKTTVGFINAAYHNATCTHQFNFDIVQQDGLRFLHIADGYSGDRYMVGILNNKGKIDFVEDGMKVLVEELKHYNANSIRFYAPSLDSIDPEVLSKVILGKI